MATSSGKIRLKSMEGHLFEIERDAAMLSPVLSHVIEDIVDKASSSSSVVVPVFNGTTKTLAKIVEYMKNHAENKDQERTKLAKEKLEFVEGFEDMDELLDVMNLASYLDLSVLLRLVAARVAFVINDMTVEEIRSLFKIQGDYTVEEEAELGTAWAF
ncbi:PREDICTED: SKP1-like protein 17 [Tarenaya hassleriana]|uniref:SKP1-like protein 17 n=1 Tax=Tarenaya hassleriana TaxID=28532 RepID=UPI00053C4C2B|nr:PREDICTED: SKP1-like protein 17 [Tarenaya hassleriana]